ncbi:MAG: hypothetical protein B0A82_14270 [Alkalinema sp. CACIAM 70d]|nr:MAG: hypothetical protein B0A82_14270 [Alkalinema sp. CACIAM 70d]
MLGNELHQEIHLELLLGNLVIDVEGKEVGRIEEVLAAQQGDEWVITDFLVGWAAIAERLSVQHFFTKAFTFFHESADRPTYRIPWHQLDLSDPLRPCLTCTVQELKVQDC